MAAAWPAIIFCRTRHGADRLAKQLARSEIKAAAIHGGRSQSQRTRALADFTGGRVHALVATDVAARGIHVDGVASVVHYDPPEDHKAYVHRSGRTARAGQDGVVISLIQPDQKRDTRRLQRDVGLDEPVTSPDLATVRELTPPAVRQLAPAEREERRANRGDDRSPDYQPRRNRSNGKHRGGPRHGSGNGNRNRNDNRADGGNRGDGGNRQGGPKRNGKPGQRNGGPKTGSGKQGGHKHGGQNRSHGQSEGHKPGGQRSGGPTRNGGKPGQRRSGNSSGGQRRSAA